jgi:hypothetical protein
MHRFQAVAIWTSGADGIYSETNTAASVHRVYGNNIEHLTENTWHDYVKMRFYYKYTRVFGRFYLVTIQIWQHIGVAATQD